VASRRWRKSTAAAGETYQRLLAAGGSWQRPVAVPGEK